MLAFSSTSEEQSSTYDSSGLQGRASDSARRPATSDSEGRWLSIDAACKILGVDKSTLRRWSDRGKIPVFRTPGGHRRYSEGDLHRFLAGDIGSSRQISRRELAALTHEEFERGCLAAAAERAWFDACAGQSREQLRQLCGQMLDVSVRYASGRGNQERLVADGCELARELGAIMAEADLTSSEAVDAFLVFRRPLLDAVSRYTEQENLSARRTCRIIKSVTTYLDAVLTSTIEAHEAMSAR